MDCARRCGTSRRAKSTRTCRRTTTRRAWYEYWPSSSSLPSHWPLSLHRPGPAQPSPCPVPSLASTSLVSFSSTALYNVLYSTRTCGCDCGHNCTRPDRPDPTHTTRRGPHEHDTPAHRCAVRRLSSSSSSHMCRLSPLSRPLRPVQSSPLTCHWMNE